MSSNAANGLLILATSVDIFVNRGREFRICTFMGLVNSVTLSDNTWVCSIHALACRNFKYCHFRLEVIAESLIHFCPCFVSDQSILNKNSETLERH